MHGMNPRKNKRYKWGKMWRQRGHVRKGLVEDCVAVIDVAMIRDEAHSAGIHVMEQPASYPPVAIGHVFLQRDGFSLEAEHDGARQRFTLTETPTRFNGRRVWLICPDCQKRINKLYKPAGKQFACRDCHQLTYRTRQQHKCEPVTGNGLSGSATYATWQRVNAQLRAAGCTPVEIPYCVRQSAGLIPDQTRNLPPIVIRIGGYRLVIPRE